MIMKERMQLVARFTESPLNDGYVPVLLIYNSMGHLLGKMTLGTAVYDDIHEPIEVANMVIDEYIAKGSMVKALETIWTWKRRGS